jgi:HAD superfamily hydrolase (TIGR01509 family)
LFDLDGTLIDSNDAHAEAWAQAMREHGVDAPPAEIRRLIGMGGDKILPAVAHVSEDSDRGRAITRRKKDLFSERLPALEPTRGARGLMQFLRNREIEVVIATSAEDGEMNALLRRAGVDDLIPERASKNDAATSKPDPDIVHAALERAGARPKHTALVGDTPYDIEAAERAGLDAIALRCGGYWADDSLRGAIAIFDDPEALLAHWTKPDRH